MNKGKTGKNLLFSKKEYYKFQLAILIVILIFLVMALSAEGQTFRGDDNRQYSNMMQIIMSVSAGLLGYIAWTVRRFIRKVDNMQCFLSKAIKILITIATEHRSNHDSCVNFDELIKSEDGSV